MAVIMAFAEGLATVHVDHKGLGCLVILFASSSAVSTAHDIDYFKSLRTVSQSFLKCCVAWLPTLFTAREYAVSSEVWLLTTSLADMDESLRS